MSAAEALAEQLIACGSRDDVEAFVQGQPELNTSATIDSLVPQVLGKIRVDLGAAEALLQRIEWLAEPVAAGPRRALLIRTRANVDHFRSDYPKAHSGYLRAIEAYSALGDDLQVAITKSSGLVNASYLAEQGLVGRWSDEAEAVFVERDDPQRLASLMNNRAGAAFRRDRWEEALDLYGRAAELFRSLDRPGDVAICYRNRATCLVSLLRFEQALREYRECLDACASLDLAALAAEARYNIAYLYFLRGEYEEASRRFGRARRAALDRGDAYHASLCDLDESELHLEINRTQEARELALRAADSFALLGLDFERARSLEFAAVAEGRLGQDSRSIALLSRAGSFFEADDNPVGLARVGLRLAELRARRGRFDEASTHLETSRELLPAGEAQFLRARLEILAAEVHLELGDRASVRRCLAAARRVGAEQHAVLSWQLDLVESRASEDEGDLEGAVDSLKRACSALDALWSQLGGDEQRSHFLSDKRHVYEGLVVLGLRQGRAKAAFEAIQLAKSPGLAELMTYGLDEDRLAAVGLDAATVERARERRAGALRREGAASQPSADGVLEPRSVDVALLQESIPEDATLVEYFLARGQVYVALAARERLEVRALGSARSALEAQRLLAFRLTRSAESLDLSAPVDRRVQKSVESLHAQLVSPWIDDCPTPSLVFAPHGFLHRVPFHALQQGEHAPLGIERLVSYAPSGSILQICRRREASLGTGALVLGYADADAPQLEAEANAVAKHVEGSRLYLGTEATRSCLSDESEKARFVHVASHCHFRVDNPLYSGLRLADGELTALDLHRARLVADLVSLSGCSTGHSTLVGADEQLGLVRGALFAGARCVLATLWDVADSVGAAFIDEFYRQVGQGVSLDQALRSTMTGVRETSPNPFYWAPFVLLGAAGN
ncbi:MAG: CHAT domain-containing tetratricopeptide repeat protein [Acidobacteriota bacterium]